MVYWCTGKLPYSPVGITSDTLFWTELPEESDLPTDRAIAVVGGQFTCGIPYILTITIAHCGSNVDGNTQIIYIKRLNSSNKVHPMVNIIVIYLIMVIY